MKTTINATGIRVTSTRGMLAGTALTLAFVAGSVVARAQESKPAPASSETEIYRTFYLANVTQQSELNEISTAVRNMLSHARIYSVPSQNAISIRGSAEDLQLAQKLISDLDRPRAAYRLIFTITDIDNGKRGTAQSFTLVAIAGERTSLKQGSRVPVATGTYDAANAGPETQVQYQDVGLHIDATLTPYAGELNLRAKVEQSSVAEGKSAASGQDPVLLQSVIDGAANLAPGKPFVLGAVDLPGTTHQQEIAVVADLIK